MYLNPDWIYLNPDRIYLNPDGIYLNPDRIYLNPDRIYLNPDRMYPMKKQISKPREIIQQQSIYLNQEKYTVGPIKLCNRKTTFKRLLYIWFNYKASGFSSGLKDPLMLWNGSVYTIPCVSVDNLEL